MAWNPESKTVLGSLTWGHRADVQLNETLLVTDVISPLLCQNVRTTGASTAEPEGLRITGTTLIVIAVLAPDGSVSRVCRHQNGNIMSILRKLWYLLSRLAKWRTPHSSGRSGHQDGVFQ